MPTLPPVLTCFPEARIDGKYYHGNTSQAFNDSLNRAKLSYVFSQYGTAYRTDASTALNNYVYNGEINSGLSPLTGSFYTSGGSTTPPAGHRWGDGGISLGGYEWAGSVLSHDYSGFPFDYHTESATICPVYDTTYVPSFFQYYLDYYSGNGTTEEYPGYPGGGAPPDVTDLDGIRPANFLDLSTPPPPFGYYDGTAFANDANPSSTMADVVSLRLTNCRVYYDNNSPGTRTGSLWTEAITYDASAASGYLQTGTGAPFPRAANSITSFTIPTGNSYISLSDIDISVNKTRAELIAEETSGGLARTAHRVSLVDDYTYGTGNLAAPFTYSTPGGPYGSEEYHCKTRFTADYSWVFKPICSNITWWVNEIPNLTGLLADTRQRFDTRAGSQ